MAKWWMETQGSIQSKIMLRKKIEAETEDIEDQPWNHLPKPQWEN